MATAPTYTKGVRGCRLHVFETRSGLGSIPHPTRRSSRRMRGLDPNSIDLGAVGKHHTHGSGEKHASSRIELGQIVLQPFARLHTGRGIPVRASRHAVRFLRECRIARLFRDCEGGAIGSLDRPLRRYTAPIARGGGPVYRLTKSAGRRAIRLSLDRTHARNALIEYRFLSTVRSTYARRPVSRA